MIGPVLVGGLALVFVVLEAMTVHSSPPANRVAQSIGAVVYASCCVVVASQFVASSDIWLATAFLVGMDLLSALLLLFVRRRRVPSPGLARDSGSQVADARYGSVFSTRWKRRPGDSALVTSAISAALVVALGFPISTGHSAIEVLAPLMVVALLLCGASIGLSLVAISRLGPGERGGAWAALFLATLALTMGSLLLV